MNLADKIGACTQTFTVERKTLRDPKALSNSQYKISNPQGKEFSVVEIDRCVFDSNLSKCDYAVQLLQDKQICFIELKGSDNNKSLQQLYTTLVNTETIYKDYIKKVRLVVSKSEAPRFLDKKTIRAIAKIVNDPLNGPKGNFIRTNRSFTEHMS
jgi:hypothetical protein